MKRPRSQRAGGQWSSRGRVLWNYRVRHSHEHLAVEMEAMDVSVIAIRLTSKSECRSIVRIYVSVVSRCVFAGHTGMFLEELV